MVKGKEEGSGRDGDEEKKEGGSSVLLMLLLFLFLSLSWVSLFLSTSMTF